MYIYDRFKKILNENLYSKWDALILFPLNLSLSYSFYDVIIPSLLFITLFYMANCKEVDLSYVKLSAEYNLESNNRNKEMLGCESRQKT